MNQTAFLRDFTAYALTAFEQTGLADAATFEPANTAPPIPCTVLIDRDVRDFGDDLAPLSYSRLMVTLQRREVDPAAVGDRIVLSATGETWILEQRIGQDEAMTQWVVRDA